jgi:two-component system, NarL family, response regulator DevR
VFLLDDHDIVRRGLRDLLASARDVVVVGESPSAEQATRMILELKPNVMVLDVQLQDGTGIEVCRRVRAVDPDIRGLLLTSAGDDEALVAAVLAGADGYLVKLTGSLEVLNAVRRVGTGKSLIDRDQKERVVARLRADLTYGRSPGLADAERDLLSHLLDGATDAEIAEHNGQSPESMASSLAALVEVLTGVGAAPAPRAAGQGSTGGRTAEQAVRVTPAGPRYPSPSGSADSSHAWAAGLPAGPGTRPRGGRLERSVPGGSRSAGAGRAGR